MRFCGTKFGRPSLAGSAFAASRRVVGRVSDFLKVVFLYSPERYSVFLNVRSVFSARSGRSARSVRFATNSSAREVVLAFGAIFSW